MHIQYSYKCRFVTIYRLVMLEDRQHQVSRGGNYDKFCLLMYILNFLKLSLWLWFRRLRFGVLDLIGRL